MSKILVVAAAAAVALGSVAVTADANARHLRAHGYYGYAPGYVAPRGFRESPTYAPDAPASRSYNNPGIPDFQNGSRG
jgi:alkylation response protein AidB-like acyl-CoA dehydrogenase